MVVPLASPELPGEDLGSVLLVLRHGSRRLDELCRCLDVLLTLPGRRTVLGLVAAAGGADSCWLLRFPDDREKPLLREADREASLADALRSLVFEVAPPDAATGPATLTGAAQPPWVPAASLEARGPMALSDAAPLVLDALLAGCPDAEECGSVLVHLHERASAQLALAGDDCGCNDEAVPRRIHMLLGVHEDAPDEVLSAIGAASAGAARGAVVPLACAAVALGPRPLHSSAVLQLLGAHAGGWLAPRLRLRNGQVEEPEELQDGVAEHEALAPRDSCPLLLPAEAAAAARLTPGSLLHLFVPVPGQPPSPEECEPADIDVLTSRIVHLAVTASLVWSHGAYLESETQLTLVWNGEVAVTLDRSCLDELPADDRAPREGNIVTAAFRKARRPAAMRPYASAVQEAACAALAATVSPVLYELCLPQPERPSSRSRCRFGLEEAAGHARLPRCPLSDAPVFCFLSGLTPPPGTAVEGRRLERVDWPDCAGGPCSPGFEGVAMARAIYAVQHLHTLGRLLPALEAEAEPRTTADPPEAVPPTISVREAQGVARGVHADSCAETSEAAPESLPAPAEDLIGSAREAHVAVLFRISARHMAGEACIFIDGEEVGAMAGHGEAEANGTTALLQVCFTKRDFKSAGVLHHYTLLRERTRVGDIIHVSGYCGVARGTVKPTLFARRVLRIDIQQHLRADEPTPGVELNTAGDPLIVCQTSTGLVAAHKPAGTPTFWPEKDKKREKRQSALAAPVSGQPFIKVLEEWALRKALKPLHVLVPLKQEPSGLVVFAERGSLAASAAAAGKGAAGGADAEAPLLRFLALVAGRLPSSGELGKCGPLFRCEEPLRELSHSGGSDAVPAAPAVASPEDSMDRKGGSGRRQRPPKLPASTDFETLCHLDDGAGGVSLIVATPRTRVAHQVRRHLRFLGCPVCCDKAFGDFRANRRYAGVFGLGRLFLHCFEVEVPGAWSRGTDVVGGGTAAVSVLRCPVPQDLRALLDRILTRGPAGFTEAAAEWIGLTPR